MRTRRRQGFAGRPRGLCCGRANPCSVVVTRFVAMRSVPLEFWTQRPHCRATTIASSSRKCGLANCWLMAPREAGGNSNLLVVFVLALFSPLLCKCECRVPNKAKGTRKLVRKFLSHTDMHAWTKAQGPRPNWAKATLLPGERTPYLNTKLN